MQIPKNEDSNKTQKPIQNDQIVKKDDLWSEPQPISQNFYDNPIIENQSSSKQLQSHQPKIQVKLQPQDNIIYHCSQSRDSLENPQNFPKKTKKIHKGHQQKETIDNSLFSNSNRKHVTIILKALQCLPDCTNFKEKYLNPYEINGDRQNIVILPFLVLDFFIKEIMKVYVQEMNHKKIIIFDQELKQKINLLFTVLRRIFSQYKLGLQKSKEKKQKKRQNSDANDKLFKTFISMADYFNNKIPELFLLFVSKKFQIRRQDLNFLLITSQPRFSKPEVKIEDETTIKFVDSAKEYNVPKQPKTSYSMEMIAQCEKFIQTIFPFKEREIFHSYDRFFSIRLGLTYLREVFEFPHDYILDIKKILFISKAEEHKRQSGRGKKSSPYQMKKIYSQIESLQRMGQHNISHIDALGVQFLKTLMVISLTKEKHVEVLQKFLASVNRKIQYLSDQNSSQDNSTSQILNQRALKYKKSHYKHFINLLSRGLQDKSIQKNSQSDQSKSKSMKKKVDTCLRYSLSQWIYPPFFQSKNYLCKIQEQQHQFHNSANLNLFKQMNFVYLKAKSQLEGQVQEDGISLIFQDK